MDGWAYGPGALDMKAGVVMALEAIRLVREIDADRPIVLLLSGDEETGSRHSRALIEQVAKECRAVFVLEPAQGPAGAYKTARKGVGQFRLEITGVPSHSGVDFSAGHSAVRELAWQIDQISALTDLERGTTLNVGVVAGGTQSNVVPASAWAEIDLRVTAVADADAVKRELEVSEAPRSRVPAAADRRPEPPSHGADRRHRCFIRSGEGAGSVTRIRIGRSLDRRRLGWELHLRSGHPDPGWHGRRRAGSTCGE